MTDSPHPILIVGGGLAGIFCALKLAPLPVAILAPSKLGVGGASYWAQGGVAAAVEEGDTPEIHAADTIKAGAGIVDEAVALGVALEARARINDLAGFGAPFDRDARGVLQPSREAAHSHRRIVRVKGDAAGRAIMEALARQVARTPSIEIIDGVSAYDIWVRDGRVFGVSGYDADGRPRDFPCHALVLATGGVGHLYRVTTNPIDACGAGLGMAAHAGAIIAVVLAIAVYILLWRTTIGYRIRAVGLNRDAARYSGINVPFYQVLSLTLSGGFAGLAGVVEVIGVQHRLLEGITSGYGFSGIVAALFGGLHPLGTIPASWLFGSLLVGADKMQRAVQVPSALIDTVLGLIVMFVVGSALLSRRWAARRALAAPGS